MPLQVERKAAVRAGLARRCLFGDAFSVYLFLLILFIPSRCYGSCCFFYFTFIRLLIHVLLVHLNGFGSMQIPDMKRLEV